MYGGTSGQGWLGLAIFLVICGLVIGLALVRSDLINPISSLAESKRYQAETQQLIEQNNMQAKQESELLEAQTKVEIERLEAEAAHRMQLYELETQRLKEELQRAGQVHQEEMRQAQEMAALKRSLINTAGIIITVSIGVSLIILSVGVTRRLWRNPPPSPRLVQANLHPYPPLSKTWKTLSREQAAHSGNGGRLQHNLQRP